MNMKAVHTLVLGTGPAGLAAAYRLTKAGLPPVLLEENPIPGGMMRSLHQGQFIMDIGRKELYSRIPEVEQLWDEVLGDEFRPYPHRVGVLYDGRILEMSTSYRGISRGMTWGMFLACALDLLWCWAKPIVSKPRNYEEYWYRICGRRFSRILSQGFREKFVGQKWAEMPLPGGTDNEWCIGTLQAIKKGLSLASEGPVFQSGWRHPAKGTGQISELLKEAILAGGGRFHFQARATGMAVSQGRVTEVKAEIGLEQVTYRPQHVVYSYSIESLVELLTRQHPQILSVGSPVAEPPRRGVILVYLFLDETPRIPHAWLEVTCPQLKAGRITNYAAFNGDMVPEGKTCLCIEFFCSGEDPLYELSCQELADLALKECTWSGLVDPTRCFDTLVLRLPNADAATNWRDWVTEARVSLLDEIKGIENLYFVQRPGMDKSTYAGLKAAEAILSGNRTDFDDWTDPTKGEGVLEGV